MRRVLSSAVVLGALVASGQAFAAGNPEDGKKAFAKCRACHQVEAGKNAVGPSLAGIVGRKAGTGAGFKYSDAMAGKGITWTKETLAAYLGDPKGYIPGNKMVFPGIKNATEMENVIAYLETLK